MSAPSVPFNPASLSAPSGSSLWRQQAGTILWVELKKNFVTKRGFWIYLLALAPAIIVWVHSFVELERGGRHPLENDTTVMAGIFQIFFLRPAVFFGCVGIFTYLFRGEVLERSLHFYFLAPIRREVLVLGKYLAGLITSAFFFCGSIALTFAGMYAHYPAHQVQQFLSAAGYGHLFAYVGITALACMAYGSLFLWLGIRFRNPVIPAVVLLLWESVNLFLPLWLKRISVLYYLRSLTPVSIDLGGGPGALFGGVSEPASAPVAIISLFVITGLMLMISVRQLKRTEISYSTD